MSIFKRVAFFIAGLFFASAAFAQGFDHSHLDRFLKAYVDDAGRVNYASAKQNRAELDAYLDQIQKTNLKDLQAGPGPESLAFWLNVYHAGLLSLVLENYPLKSVQDIPSFWERQFLKVGVKDETDKTRYSLSQIRSNLLLAQFNDEKIHVALAFAAQDGPLFPQTVFTGPRVLGQLYKCARREVARPEMVKIDRATGKIQLSRVFEWYAPDFERNFGRPERRGKLSRSDTAIVNFIIRYSKKISEVKFLKEAQYKLEYDSFNYTLNDSSTAA